MSGHADAPPIIAQEGSVEQLAPHPKLAIAAFLLALTSAGIIFGVLLLQHFVATIDGGVRFERQEQLRNPMGVVFFAALLLDLVAVGLAGLSLARGQRRLFPTLALSVGLLVLAFCFVGFFV